MPLKLVLSRPYVDLTAEMISEDPTPSTEIDPFLIKVIALSWVSGLLTPALGYIGYLFFKSVHL